MGLINSLIQFTAGVKALSAEMNQNFETLRLGHNDQESRVSSLETGKLALSGGTMTGAIVGVAPTAATHLTRRDYVDNILNSSFKSGLTLSNNASDANNDIDTAIGACVDDTNSVIIKLTSPITKRLDANFAEGTNQGGLDTGTKAVSTWYYRFAIAKADGTPDQVLSASSTSPTMPTGFVYKRLLDAIPTDASGNLRQIIDIGDMIVYQSPDVLDVNVTDLNQTTSTYTLASIPVGYNVIFAANIMIQKSAAQPMVYIRTQGALSTPSTTDPPLTTLRSPASAVAAYQLVYPLVSNTSAQILARSSETGTTFKLAVIGYSKPR